MEIPLFPLPNLVLFPHVAVPLHIFEERYKLMINRCVDNAEIFGLVLLHEDTDQEGESVIHRVGVTARVVQMERLEDGRMNILCAGESRFRIREYTGRTPYWTARVEFFEDEPEPESAVQEAYEQAAELYRRAMLLTARLKETENPRLELPDSPVSLSFMISYVLDIPAARKQELLETTSTVFRLRALIKDLESAIPQIETQIAHRDIGSKARGNGDLGKPH